MRPAPLIAFLLAASPLAAQQLTLEKSVFKAGEPIRVVWSGSDSPEDRVAFFGENGPPGKFPRLSGLRPLSPSGASPSRRPSQRASIRRT